MVIFFFLALGEKEDRLLRLDEMDDDEAAPAADPDVDADPNADGGRSF
jgi:hypothetical protein